MEIGRSPPGPQCAGVPSLPQVPPAAGAGAHLLAEAAQALTRSPRPRYGRTGTSGVRCVDLEDLCGSVDTADELFEAFRLEGAL